MFVPVSMAGQTSNNLYFLYVGESYYQGKSNQLIPIEGPAIWRIETNFDNESLYIKFIINDPTNPDELYNDELRFYIDYSENQELKYNTTFGFSVKRDHTIKYYRYNEITKDYCEVDYSTNKFMGTIEIQNEFLIIYKFNYTQFGYPNISSNQRIYLAAIYHDHIIGSYSDDYNYPVDCNPLLKSTWAIGYFIPGYDNNQLRNDIVWIIVFLIIGSVFLISTIIYKKMPKRYNLKHKNIDINYYPRVIRFTNLNNRNNNELNMINEGNLEADYFNDYDNLW